jgi:putative DNA primase/helicase
VTDKISAARAYAARGWQPIRLHGIAADGLCTCRDRTKTGHEKTAGKHPTENGWQSSPPMTDEEIAEAWSGWRAGHNVGIATGAPSGFFVLDVDPDNGGTESIKRLQADHEALEVDCAVTTGSGGWHLYFRMPADFEPTNRRGGLKEYPGLDIRGSGGQVVAPPSASAKGAYTWLKEGEPGDAPDWLLELLRPVAPTTPAPAAPTVAPAGDEETQRLERYAATVRDLEITRLTAMRDAATADGTGYVGDGWNETTFMVACSLLELANSPWTIFDASTAYVCVFDHAPRDAGFTDEDVNKCFQSAVTRVGNSGRPYPAKRADTASEIASWASEPGVRVDPILLKGSTPPPGVTVAADEEAAAEKPMRSWDDLGNAMRVVDHYGKGLRWVAEAEQWALFHKGRWQLVKPNIVQGLVQRMFDELVPRTEALAYGEVPEGDDDDETSPREKFLKWLKAQRMSARIAAAQKEAQGRWELQASMADFDGDPLLLNVANGVVDLRNGDLLPPDPKLMLMRQSPVAYDPAAPAGGWQRFLDRVQPDQAMQQYLQRILGYSLTGDTSEQAFFIWHGDGANGKSVASGLVGTILGDYGQVVAPSTLLSNTQDEHPTGVAMMQGKRWLPATETAPGRRLDEEKVKNLTGGEPVAARFMGKDFFEFVPSGKIHLITNHLPFLSDAKSIWRRIHLILWAVSIPDAEVDRKLEQKLRAEELPGILAWLVRGAMAWREQGLNAPDVALEDLARYRGDSDSFGDFLRERTMKAPGAKTETTLLYRAYTNWCFDQGIRKPMTQQSFVATMVERKHERFRNARSRGFADIVPLTVAAELPWDKS